MKTDVILAADHRVKGKTDASLRLGLLLSPHRASN